MVGVLERNGLAVLTVAALSLCSGCGEDSPNGPDGRRERMINEIADWEYVHGRFFFLDNPDGPAVRLVTASLEVWIDDRNGTNDLEQHAAPGHLTLSGDPAFHEEASHRATGNFVRLQPGWDFFVRNDVVPGHPVLMLTKARAMAPSMTSAMGVRYRTLDGNSIGGSRGSDPDSLILKLIRPSAGMGGTDPLDLTLGIFASTAKLELRNVYELWTGLAPEDLEVHIRRKTVENAVVNPDRLGRNTYLEILGLDLLREEGPLHTPGADGQIDRDRIDREGYLVFRELQPFDPTPDDILHRFVESRPDTLQGEFTVPLIYSRNDWSTVESESDSEYKIEVTRIWN